MSLLPRPPMRVALSLLLLSVLLGGGIWVALPARYLPVDIVGSLLALLCTSAGLALLFELPRALLLARVACWTTLVLGSATCSALAFVAAHLSGLYGPVGAGGALLMAIVSALILPYLVGLPLLQLAWLRTASAGHPALAGTAFGASERAKPGRGKRKR